MSKSGTIHAIGVDRYYYERKFLGDEFRCETEGSYGPSKKVWFLWKLLGKKPKVYLGFFLTKREVLSHIGA